MSVWEIHNDTMTTELIDDGFISIGWDDLGALKAIGGGREGLKRALSNSEPEAKPRSIAAQAGMLRLQPCAFYLVRFPNATVDLQSSSAKQQSGAHVEASEPQSTPCHAHADSPKPRLLHPEIRPRWSSER